MKFFRIKLSPKNTLIFISSILALFFVSNYSQASVVEVIREIRKTCDGVTSLVTNGTRAKIQVSEGYEVEISADNSVSIVKDGVLLERIKDYSAADRQTCINSLTRILTSSTEGNNSIPRVEVVYGTLAAKENSQALKILREYDGKRIFLDTVNMDVQPGWDENDNIINECYENGAYNRVFDGDISENVISIPLPIDYYKNSRSTIYFDRQTYADYACEYAMQFRLNDTRAIPISRGGTGVVNLPIRKTFLVTETRVGYRTIFQLREE